MANLIYDKALSFGQLAVISTGVFPDIQNLGKAAGAADHYPGKEFTSVDRMTVDLCCKSPAGGTSVTVTVQGSADGSGGWADVGKNTFTLAELQSGPCPTAISPNNFKFLRFSITALGSFTGSAEAFLNTYTGK